MLTVQIGDMTWGRKPGAPSTAEELVAAQQHIQAWLKAPERHWNPWDYEEMDVVTEAAFRVRDEWSREGVDPRFTRMSEAEVDADVETRMAEWRAEYDRKATATKARQVEAAKHYDPDREQARLQLLEDQLSLRRVEEELAGYEDGTLGMDNVRRGKKILDLEDEKTKWRNRVADLTAEVGDPEAVVDELGQTPADRREHTLSVYSARRHVDVAKIRAQLAELDEQIAAAGKPVDSKLSAQRAMLKMDLERYLSAPPLTAPRHVFRLLHAAAAARLEASATG